MASFIAPSTNSIERSVDGKLEYVPVLPFINSERHTRLGAKWYIRFIVLPVSFLLSPVIMLVRLAVTLPLLFILAVTCLLLNLGTDPNRPLNRYRSTVLVMVATPIIRTILFVMGYIVIVRNRHLLSGDAFIVVANHTDFMDVPCMYCAVSTAYVSKEAVARFWALRAISNATRTIFIHRNLPNEDAVGTGILLHHSAERPAPRSGFSQLETRVQVMRKDRERLWQPIMLFPEGTTTAGTGILRLHTSAFRLGVPVQPISIRYDSCLHTEYIGSNLLLVALKKLVNPFCIVTLTVLEQVDASSENCSPRELADEAGVRIAKSLNVPYLPYTSNDGFYFRSLRPTSEACTPEFLRDYGWAGTEAAFNIYKDKEFTEGYRLPRGPIVSSGSYQ